MRGSVQEYKEDVMRAFRYEDGRSQRLEDLNIKGNRLILKGVE